MNKIKTLIATNESLFEKYNISLNSEITKYNSRRNDVYKITTLDSTIVLKHFSNMKSNNYNMLKEIKIITTLNNNNINVPKILSSTNSFYIMDHISDITLLKYLELSEKKSINNQISEETKIVLTNFLKWLNSFYSTLSLSLNKEIILSDINLRNFLVLSNNEISGIDFEAIGSGKIIEDLGKICAYILTYNPTFTDYKYNIISFLENQMISIFNVNPNRLIEEKIKQLTNLKIRRKIIK
ncbi:hypothetical protein QUF55_03375 [Clostridiaceae bacterium HSG29]|nr:hypothetical protein [Clostridiaceae bacterium HSG29]